MSAPMLPDQQDKLLLQLFVQRMKQELVETAIAAIRPDVERAAAEALEELKPMVRQHFDIRADSLVFHLSIGGKP